VQHAGKPTFMAPDKAGEAIRSRVDPKTPLTVADVAAQTGLALRDAESGLTWLSTEYRGQLRVTSEGTLLHVFPAGFTKPWEGRDARKRLARAIGRGLMGALRFVVRAWVAIVLVGYAAFFVGLLLAMTFARQGNDDRRSNDGLPGGALAYGMLRLVSDAFFWTFNPWSPFSVYSGYGGYGARSFGEPRYARERVQGPKVPLYERVNRFFFGPQPPPEEPREMEKRVVEAIRAGKGRIGLADVMRVTGLPREEADPMMARLMLDYDGDVAVSEEGGIVYRFAEVRRTASETSAPRPPPAVWDSGPKPVPPLTGNSAGANLAIVALNAFNLLMGVWSIENGMTLERAAHLFDRIPHPIVDTGLPIALGVVPLVFSALLFAVPVGRALFRPLRRRRFVEEKGRLAVLKHVLERIRAKDPITDGSVAQAWSKATGQPGEAKRLDRALVGLGGDVAIGESGQTRWRFADLETEAAAVEAERDAAAEDEARVGQVVFASDKP
jgi:hypothetical protein